MARILLDSSFPITKTMPDLNFLPAVVLAEQIRKKKISAVEVVEAHIARIERLNPILNAFVELNFESARRAAVLADEKVWRQEELGPLHGVPISIKSSIEVQGMRCEAGTKLCEGNVAKKNAPLVERLRNAGAVILGMTNTPELLMAWETDNLLYGRTNNPWDLSRTAGGSSGGEAAAVASGCSAGGVGSDGGGSIRVPAHFSGICGLKATPGRIPATGHFPQSVGPFALTGVVGPMTRTIIDLKVFFEVMQGHDDGDPSAAPVPVRWPNAEELKKTRIAYFEHDGRTPVTPETRAAIRKAAELLRAAGFQVEEFCPKVLEQARQIWWKFFGVTGGVFLRDITKGREQDLSPMLKQFMGWVEAEPKHTVESLLDMWVQRDQVRMEIFEQMNEFPILLCPAAAVPAFHHGERSWTVEGKTVKYLDAWSYAEWFNVLGMPAAVVPVAQSPEGLPIGVQIAGKPWQEELVLSVAEVIEQTRGEWKAPPEIG